MWHLVIKGSNQEIGKALGDIAQKWLNVKLSKYAGPLYAPGDEQQRTTDEVSKPMRRRRNWGLS